MPSPGPRQLRFVRALFFGPLLLALALGVVAWLRDQVQPAPLLMLAGYGVVAWLSMSALSRRGARLQWFVSLALLNVLVAVPEMALRAAAVRYESGIEFGYPRPHQFVQVVRDPELFFTLDPATEGINSWGFRGPEAQAKQPGVFRILFLGDSCTFAGEPPYPSQVEAMLNEAPGARRVECVSLSMAGYTSHQGLVLARRRGAEVDPDLVVVYYGWNDHWLAYGAADADKVIEPAPPLFSRAAQKLRLLQLVAWLAGSEEPLDVLRVAPEQYRANLTEIARTFETMEVPTVFITAPTSHRALGVDRTLLELRFARDVSSVTALHEEYANIVREVATGAVDGCRLLDLHREFGELPREELQRIFIADGIHFTREGMEYVARRVASYLQAEFGLEKK